MTIVKLSTVKNGEYFKKSETSKKVYIRGPFDRYSKAYSCRDFEDVNREIFVKGTTNVAVGFTF